MSKKRRREVSYDLPKKKVKKPAFTPHDIVKHYNDANELKLEKCNWKTKLTWEGEVSVCPGLNSAPKVTLYLSFCDDAPELCPDFHIKQHPKVVFSKSLGVLFQKWKEWPVETKLLKLVSKLQKAIMRKFLDMRNDFTPEAKKWMGDLWELLRKCDIKSFYFRITSNNPDKLSCVINLRPVHKVGPIYFAVSFKMQGKEFELNKYSLTFSKSVTTNEIVRNLELYKECKSPAEVVRKIIQVAYQQRRIHQRMEDVIDYIALNLQKYGYTGPILSRKEKQLTFVHKLDDALEIPFIVNLEFKQRSATKSVFLFGLKCPVRGQVMKAEVGLIWSWGSWKSRTKTVMDWARKKMENTDAAQFRAVSRGNLQDLMMDGFKEHFNFKNFAPIKRSKPDLDSEATELDNSDAPERQMSHSLVFTQQESAESAESEEEEVKAPQPLAIPVPKVGASPPPTQNSSDFEA